MHKTDASLLLCYVDHHDKAYDWAERRKLETHPKTGAAQLVEIRERVEEIPVPIYIEVPQQAPAKPPLFAGTSDDDLLGYGVPVEWLKDVRQANEDSFMELAVHLPGEAAEALLNLATGVPQPYNLTPTRVGPVPSFPAVSKGRVLSRKAPVIDPFAHPDAQRRFRLIGDAAELERALDYPWEKWITFLHPAQRQWVERDYNGPARVSGSAGTGKTIVALHRAAFLARTNPDTRVLLTTFSETLANTLRTNLRRLIGNEPRLGEQVEVHAINAIGQRLYEVNLGQLKLASHEAVNQLIEEAAAKVEGHKFSPRFLISEWEQIADAWQLQTWEDYRDVTRLGRKTRLHEKQRRVLWSIFDQVQSGLKTRNLITLAGMFTALATRLASSQHPPFEFVVVDEAQDLSPAQLRFLAALGAGRPNGLFFAGDLGQRIFQQAFSWKSLGVDVRGRSRTLHINYRTSHQIRTQADRLLAPEVSDVDGNTEERRGTLSVFNGPQPKIMAWVRPNLKSKPSRDGLRGW